MQEHIRLETQRALLVILRYSEPLGIYSQNECVPNSTCVFESERDCGDNTKSTLSSTQKKIVKEN